MTKGEVARLLGLAAAYDRRTVGKADIEAWYLALYDLTPTEAKSAVQAHYQATERFIMPSDIRRVAEKERRTVGPPALPRPDKPDGGVYEQGMEAVRNAAAVGHERNKARRARVLRYPDLAAQLMEHPLNYPVPSHWNGYVPPREGQDTIPERLHDSNGWPNGKAKTGTGKTPRHTVATEKNDWEVRTALVAICAEALQREQADRAAQKPANDDDGW